MWYVFSALNSTLFGSVVTDISDFRYFAFHCQYGYLNNTLKDYLFSLEVPCPKFLITSFEVLPRWKTNENFWLRDAMWHFLRTLSREVSTIPKNVIYLCILWTFKDFDSTGRVYEQYMSKWVAHLCPAVPLQSRPQEQVCVRAIHVPNLSLTRFAESEWFESVVETQTS